MICRTGRNSTRVGSAAMTYTGLTPPGVDGVAVADGNAEAIMANNQDIGKSGFFFDVDPKYENNVILLNKKDEELLKKVNDILADCMANDMYSGWYEDAKKLAGIDTAQEISYTDDGKAQ